MELADTEMMRAINLFAPTSHESKSPGPYTVADSLFLKLQGTPQSVAETSEIIRDILSTHGCNFQTGTRGGRGTGDVESSSGGAVSEHEDGRGWESVDY